MIVVFAKKEFIVFKSNVWFVYISAVQSNVQLSILTLNEAMFWEATSANLYSWITYPLLVDIEFLMMKTDKN